MSKCAADCGYGYLVGVGDACPAMASYVECKWYGQL